ncbi:hypothetical protein CYY_001992 [Polysphondylium violaceum]|uniref:Uncharacterized protein n=1 Tax=Polysphondylium violaceum TaxID=133409 RepID=A0A8J4Q071_9MYCE|nr:hypothetical protein CYY_001992 [Polysphondylium violaceum]
MFNPPKVSKVKNKSAAPVQITAEQILRVALEQQQTLPKSAPKQTIADIDELEDYRTRKRQAFEVSLGRNRGVTSVWMKYAQWEESQKDLTRARSIFERAIDSNYRNEVFWIRYAEMEMKNKNINLARNVWDRAVSLLPRVPQLWYKFVFMEDMLGNYPATRAIFERWMAWKPEESSWNAYIKFETRLKLYDNARSIFERYILVHPFVKTWLKYAKYEEKIGFIDNARMIYQRAIEFLGEDGSEEELFISFAKFEERFKEIERARVIYKYAIDHVPKSKAKDLFETFTNFEKQHGDRIGIEDVIIGKKRFQYEEEVKKNPNSYDTWFDYTKLEEASGEIPKAREVYERSIANIPPTNEKKHWKRYIYLWINYALFEELVAKDIDRTRLVYSECIKLLPHNIFSFSKIWIMFAQFEIRQLNLEKARSIFGNAIGRYPKGKILDAYITLEIELGNFERVRKLYEKYIEIMPENCTAWEKYAQLESELGETDRARAIYEIAVQQPSLDRPELIWRCYIDFEIEQKEFEMARLLYRRLLERTNHVKVWISFAQFEFNASGSNSTEKARQLYNEAHRALLDSDKEERLVLLENWKQFEEENGNQETLSQVTKKIPKRLIKKRVIQLPDGSEGGVEEYFEYIFPEEQSSLPNLSLKILERAQAWKKQKKEQEQ